MRTEFIIIRVSKAGVPDVEAVKDPADARRTMKFTTVQGAYSYIEKHLPESFQGVYFPIQVSSI